MNHSNNQNVAFSICSFRSFVKVSSSSNWVTCTTKSVLWPGFCSIKKAKKLASFHELDACPLPVIFFHPQYLTLFARIYYNGVMYYLLPISHREKTLSYRNIFLKLLKADYSSIIVFIIIIDIDIIIMIWYTYIIIVFSRFQFTRNH